jgi:hypothetical protein
MIFGEQPAPSGAGRRASGVGKMKENFSIRLAGSVVSAPTRRTTLLMHAVLPQRNLESV